ncbi:MAG TPA: glycosyltransferase [Candidatus Thermoplasmatota archaeon]|jgi:glycosyltransferase involved in cell wall biosynthesis|nr:glycosyltransferase [Candidatus Thermoplasmatota archaeon]
MRVTHTLIHSMAGVFGNTRSENYLDTWLGRTARALRHADPSLEVECVFPEWGVRRPETFEDRGITYRLFPSRLFSRGREYSRALIGHARKAAAEGALLHLHGYHNTHGYRLAAIDAPKVAQHHGDPPPLMYGPRAPLDFLGGLKERWDRSAMRRLDQVYYLTDEEHAYLLGLVPEAHMRRQTMGVDFERFRPRPAAAARAKLGLPAEGPLLLFVGNVRPSKGVDLAIRALTSLDKDVRLAVVGHAPPEVRAELQGLAQAQGLQERVHWLGRVDEDALVEAYAAADLLVLPSAWEGAPVCIMEALACDVPVVATSVGAVPSMVGPYGVLAARRDAAALADALREALGRDFPPSRADAARRYSWPAIAAATLADYRRLARA